MSAQLFEYVINATAEQQIDLGIEIDPSVQLYWKAKIMNSQKKPKLDDLGDAMLHALNELLCGSTNFRQLVPSSTSINNNRSVVIAVLPHTTYWIVMNCQFNLFVLEDLGTYESCLEGKFYRSAEVEKLIADRLDQCLRVALTEFKGNSNILAVDDIKVIVKQIQGLDKYKLTRAQAGSLTQAAYNVVKGIVDRSSSKDSKVFDKKDKFGHVYVRTDTQSGQSFHVLKSSGKHLNAVMSFMEWFKENAKRVMDKRDADLNQSEKLTFFETLEQLAASEESRLEMMKLSDRAKAKLKSGMFRAAETKKLLADLVLISINKNQGHVKAIAANFREGGSNVVATKNVASRSRSKKETSKNTLADTNAADVEHSEPVNEQFSDVEPDDEIADIDSNENTIECTVIEASSMQYSDVEPDDGITDSNCDNRTIECIVINTSDDQGDAYSDVEPD
jgi:hypothetical protein